MSRPRKQKIVKDIGVSSTFGRLERHSQERRIFSQNCRVATVRFGSVTVRAWNGSSGSFFRFRRFLWGKGFSAFQQSSSRKARFRFLFRFLRNGSGGSGSSSVPGKTVPTVPVSGSGSVPGPSF